MLCRVLFEMQNACVAVYAAPCDCKNSSRIDAMHGSRLYACIDSDRISSQNQTQTHLYLYGFLWQAGASVSSVRCSYCQQFQL